MNKIVREHYPVARLPDDLREGLVSSEVRVVIEDVGRSDPVRRLQDVFARRRPPFLSREQIDRELRSVRDGWDERG